MADENNPYLDTVDSIFGDDGATALRSSLISGMKTNPDVAARALVQAEKRQIPLDMAERNLAELEEDEKFRAIDFNKLQTESPMLSDFLRDPDNAKLAHDDLNFLTAIGASVARGFGVGLEGIPDMTAATYDAAKYATGLPANSQEPVGAPVREEGGLQPSYEGWVDAYKKGEGVIGTIGNLTRKGLEDVGQGLASSAPSLVLAAGGGVAGTSAAGPVGGVVGAGTGAFIGSSSQTIGEFYLELETEAAKFNADPNNVNKISYEDLGQISLKWGAMLAAPDALVPGKAGTRVVNATVRSSIKQQALDAMKQAAETSALKRAGKEVAKDMAVEGITEGGQQFGQIVGVNTNTNQDVLTRETALEVFEATLSGTAGGLGMSVTSQGVAGTVDFSRNLMQANNTRNYLADVKTMVTDPNGKLMQRSPAKMRDYLNRITGGKDLYIDGQAVDTFYQSLTPEQQSQLNTAMPDFSTALTQAMESGGDVSINRADYHTYIQPLDQQSWLDENVRMMPEHFSAADVAEYDAFMEGVLEDVQQMVSAEGADLTQNNFYNQLMQRAGNRMAPSGKMDVAQILSENPRAFYETILDRSGNDPRVKEILDRLVRDVRINRVLPAGVGDTLRRDDFDLMIDRLRNRVQGKSGTASTKKKRPPLMAEIIRRGGIARNSPIAKELAAMGLSAKEYPALYKKGGRTDLDNIPVDELEDSLGVTGVFDRAEDLNGYASQQQILDFLRDESFGDSPVMDPQGQLAADNEAYLDDLDQAIYQAGLDLAGMSNEEIKIGLQRALEEQAQQDGGDTFNQAVFHGSPHKFDKFTMDHLGSGEGNQAYGYGLYFASQRKIAEFYRTSLTPSGPVIIVDGKAVHADQDLFPNEQQPFIAMQAFKRIRSSENLEQAIAEQRVKFEKTKSGVQEQILKLMESLQDRDVKIEQSAGQVYEVNIPEDDVLLSWDKPLSQQPQKVRDALEVWGFTVDKKATAAYDDALLAALTEDGDTTLPKQPKDPTGEEIYSQMMLYVGRNRSNLEGKFGDDVWGRADKLASELLNESGIKGLKYLDGVSRKDGEGTHNYVIFDDSAIEVLNTFYQGGADNARGSITFTPTGQAIINLFEKEDLSTVMHELGHLYWRAMTEIARLDSAPEQIRKDVDTIRAWVGAKPLAESTEALTVAQEEQIADGFLSYLREGKAPSVDMQNAFSRFKGWMMRLYRGVRDTLPAINKDVRDVFDRMLATDDAINNVSSQPGFNLDQAILNLLPKAQAEAYQRKMDKAVEEAKTRLLKKALRQSAQRNTAAWKEAEVKVREEVTQAVDNEPVYQAMAAIREAGGMSRKKLVKEYGQEILPYMAGHSVRGKGGLVARSGGADPASISGIVGYENSRAMITDIMNAQPRQARIDALVEDEMLARYGDMLNDGTIEAEALEDMHNDLRAEVLEMEKEILAKLAKIPAPTKDGIKAKAIQIMADSKVKDILPDRRLRAENKAFYDYGKALGQKNYVGATKAKAQQILNHHLYRMSLEARRSMDKKMTAWRRLLNRKDAKIGANRSITQREDGTFSAAPDLDYVYAARAVLSKYGIGSSNFDFETFFANLRRDDPDTADTLLQAYAMLTDGAPAWEQRTNVRNQTIRTAPYKNLSYADFQALADAVDNLIEVGREQHVIEIQGQRLAKQQALDELNAQTVTHKDAGMPGVSDKWTAKDKARASLWGYRAATTRVERWVKDMDRGYNGIFRKYLWQPVQDAITAYRDERKAKMKEIIDLLEPHKERLHGEPIVADELFSTIDNKSYTFEDKAELIGMLVHIGNGYEVGSNGYKLLVGNGWARFDEDGNLDTSAFDRFMQRMYREGVLVKEDMDLVQSMWKMMDSMKPAVWKAHKKMYGFYPKEVTKVPFMTPWGEYEGGYWPAIVDRTKSRDAAARENRRIAENENNITAFPTTGRGATKGRVDAYAAPLEMSLRTLPSHLDWAMRFVHIEPAVKQAAKLFLDKDFAGRVDRVSPGAVDELIFPWLQRVARQTTEMPTQQKFWRDANSVARWARSTTGVLMMAGNIINILQQMTGVAPLAYKVGYREFGKAWVQWAKGPSSMSESVNEASAVMRHAEAVFLDENYQRRVQRIIDGTSFHTKMEDFSQDFGYVGQKVLQNLVNNVGWTAAYNQAYGGKADGIQAGDDTAAIRYADTIVSETQGFANAENISNIEAQTALGKLFLMFYSFFNNQGNFLAGEVKALARADVGVGAKSAKALHLYLMCYMVPSFLADVIAAGLRGDLPEDDDNDGSALDEWFQFYLISQFRYVAAQAPFVGQAVNYVIAKFTPQTYDDQISVSPVLSTAEKVLSAPFSLYNAVFGEGDASKAVGDTLTAVGAVPGFGAPVGLVMRPAKFIADAAEGDSEINDVGDVMRGIASGRAPAD